MSDDITIQGLDWPDTSAVLAAVEEGVRDAVRACWPYPESVANAIGDAVAKQGTALPPGSHLWLTPTKERGVAVVMIRTYWTDYGQCVEVLTERRQVDPDRRRQHCRATDREGHAMSALVDGVARLRAQSETHGSAFRRIEEGGAS